MDNKARNADDRPIQSKGKYDMNFIDWDNEWNQVYNVGFTNNNINQLQKCPISGMSMEVFKSILEREFERFEYDQDQSIAEDKKLGQNHINKIKKMKMGTSSKECTVCCAQFQRGETILKLPCDHIFHENCLIPWFAKEHRCPNCRMNLKQYFEQ